jgi:DNA polymerase-3 subunit delta
MPKAMIFLLYGEDNYSSREKLRDMVERYKKANKSGLDLKYLESVSFQDLLDENQQNSIFNEKKLLVVSNSITDKYFKESFLKDYKKLADGQNIIVFLENKLAANDACLKIFDKFGKRQEFPVLSGEKLKKWIKDRLGEFGASISQTALNKLMMAGEGDLWLLSNEIKKLAAFRGGKMIEDKDVDLLVQSKIGTDIFKTIDAIALKNKKAAISLLHNHIEKGDAPLYLLSMIAFQFRNLLVVKDLMEKGKPYYSIPKLTKLHPFVVKKSYESAQRFSYLELKKIYQKIFQVDFSIKTGKLKPEEALDMFISEI